MTLRVAAGARALADLEPWFVAHTHTIDPVEVRAGCEPSLESLAEGADAVLLVGDPRRAPRTVLPGPVIVRSDGRTLPIAWLPDAGPEQLRQFAEGAAKVHRRALAAPVVAMLGQWHPKYLDLVGRLERLLQDGAEPPVIVRWTSERLIRRDLLRGLCTGPAMAIYLGQGRPSGWVGYRGTRIRHFGYVRGEPLGCVLSLTCYTASRRGVGRSFAEALPLLGWAAGTLGAVEPTWHPDNASWAVGIAWAISAGVRTLGELVVQAMPPSPRAAKAYRILGDPLAPLLPAPGCSEAAAAIEAPA